MNSSYLSKFDSECGNSFRYHFTPPTELLDSPLGRFSESLECCKPFSEVQDEFTSHTECTIVGGGLSAITLACYLWHSGIDFRIIDPSTDLASEFRQRVFVTGQRVMRSPYEHYVGCRRVYDYSLLDFAKLRYSSLTSREREQVLLATAGHRSVVPVDVFLAHLAHQIRIHELCHHHIVDTVDSIRRSCNDVIARLKSGRELRSSFIVYATGERARTIDSRDPRLVACYSDKLTCIGNSRVLVVGAGQTAANVVQSLVEKGCSVDLAFPKSEILFRCVDSTPHFFRPAGRIEALRNLDDVRFPSSMMIEYEDRFLNYIDSGDLRLLTESTLKVHGKSNELVLVRAGELVDLTPYQYIVPCIGLEQQTVFINNRVADFDCAIGEREFVIGAGARSSVGPIARNIDGHRVAAERITAAITERMPSVQ